MTNTRWMVWGFAVLTLAALVFSFLGALHPMGDMLAVIRLHLGALALLLGLVLSLLGARRGWIVSLAAALGLAATFWPGLPEGQARGRTVSVYQKNLSFRLGDPAPLIADIRAAAPDIVTLQEVSARNRAVLVALEAELPTQVICPFAAVGGVAIATRWPAVADTVICDAGSGLVAVQVLGPVGPLWLVSLHLHWPWPYRQPDQLAAVLPVLQGLDGPVILGGDFNMVPWGASVRQIANAVGARAEQRINSSFPRFAPWLPLPIDHVLGPGAATTTVRPLFGSDHFGLLVRLGI